MTLTLSLSLPRSLEDISVRKTEFKSFSQCRLANLHDIPSDIAKKR